MHWLTGCALKVSLFEDVGPRHRGWQWEATQEANKFLHEHCRVASSLSGCPRSPQVAKWSSRWTAIFLLPHVATTLASSHKCSACSCFGASPCPCLPLSEPAGVAVSLTTLATTVQRAPQGECWAVGDSLWSLPAARVCQEAGSRVTVNAFLRDLDIVAPDAADNRRLVVVADGLPLFPRTTIGHRHYDGVTSREGWGATPPVRRLQWCCFVGSSASETTSVP